MDLVAALKVLQAADEKELQSHRAETISILRQVCLRLQAHISPDVNKLLTEESGIARTFSPSVNASRQYILPETSVIDNAPDINPRTECPGANNYPLERSVGPSPLSNSNITRQKKAPPKKAEALFKAVIGAVSSIWSVRKDNVDKHISPKRSPTRDRRIEDILRIEDDIDASSTDRLLRASALLSLASEFESYQREHNEISRVDSIVQLILQGNSDTKSIHERKGSAVAKYVKGASQFKGKEKLINRAIGNGIKFKVVNKLLERRLEDRGALKECHAVILVLGFLGNRLSMAPYKDLLELVDRLFSNQALVTLPQDDSNRQGDSDSSSQKHILDAICELSPWSKNFQCRYKCTISPAPPMDENSSQPSQKRMRHSQRDDCQYSREINRSPDLLVANSRNSLSVPTLPSRNDAESNRATPISTNPLESNANNSQKSQPARPLQQTASHHVSPGPHGATMLSLEVVGHNPTNTLRATSANDADSESQIPDNDIRLPATRLSPIQSDMQIVLLGQTNASRMPNSNGRSPHNSVESSSGNRATPDEHALNPNTLSQGAYVAAPDPSTEIISSFGRDKPGVAQSIPLGSSVGTAPSFQIPEENDVWSWSNPIREISHTGQTTNDNSYQLPQNSDASAWSNFINYSPPQVEDDDAWAAWEGYELPQRTDLTAWSNPMNTENGYYSNA